MTTSETLNNIVIVFIAKQRCAEDNAKGCAMLYVNSQAESDRELCKAYLKEAEIWRSAIQIVNQNRS